MFTSAVGYGSSSEAYSAGVEASSEAVSKLNGSPVFLAIVFCSPEYDQVQVLKGIQSIIGESVPLAGASTAGEILNTGPAKKDSVVVMLHSSDTVSATVVSSKSATDGEQAGADLFNRLAAASPEIPLKLICIFADGLTVNPSAIIRGIETADSSKTTIVGGSAGDNGKFVKTFQYHQGDVFSNGVVAIGFRGALAFAVGVRHGWLPISLPKTITAATGNVIHTIDNEPAIRLYEQYLGPEEVHHLSDSTLGEIALSYPLGLVDTETDDVLLRAPFSVDNAGSITCGGEMPVGATVQLMIGSRDEAVAAASESAKIAFDQLAVPPTACLIFSCHVRNTLFASNEKAKAEVDAVINVIGTNVPLAGFYTYAEQAPILDKTQNIKLCKPNTHNETLVTVLLGEDTTSMQ